MKHQKLTGHRMSPQIMSQSNQMYKVINYKSGCKLNPDAIVAKVQVSRKKQNP